MDNRNRAAPSSMVAKLALILSVIAFAGFGWLATKPVELGITNLDSLDLEDTSVDPVLGVQQHGSGPLARFSDASGTPEVEISAAGAVTMRQSPAFPTGAVSGAAVADVSRSLVIPLGSFRLCDGGVALDSTSGADAFPDFAEISTNLNWAIEWDDTGGSLDEDTQVCSSVVVPIDWKSGVAFRVIAGKDAHTGGGAETLSLAVARNGATLLTAGTTEVTTSTVTSYTVTPTSTGVVASDALNVALAVVSAGAIDDTVRVLGIHLTYTAEQ